MTGGASLPAVSPASTRERLLSEGAQLFVARGYHGVSMREVAAAVGVTKPALYHHYADKEALFLAILDGALAGLSGVVERARQPRELRGQLQTLIYELLISAPQQRVGLQLASELKHVSRERRADFEQRYRAVWMGGLGRLMEEAAVRGELRSDLSGPLLTRALLGLLYPLVSGPPAPDPDATARALVSLFLDGAGQG
ncbi:TetR/AcrR family transcriptional regulator [Deinococcus rubellus]|uniref:TetR/AcrR family transcriptional regulator n=1 Tax=Deinococcus rubellus TaxID=1889240 RepID=A0ABY5YG69_9DEIO|nr:TetR/AcrR family transcriptional regulator [Deinococcus rubellus]UWX63294.1 TetR/AcrR family transcriptional regulator [Deinococcus rubellus]